MKVLIIGRSLPDETSDVGAFEYGHFQQMFKENANRVFLYGFVDTRSIKVLRSIGQQNGPHLAGYRLPIGGLYKKSYDLIKFRLFKSLLQTFEETHGAIDLVHFHFPLMTANIAIMDYLKQRNIKIVVTEHWSQVQNMNLTKREVELLKHYVATADKVIAVSHKLAESMEEYAATEFAKITILPNMIDSAFTYVPKNQAVDYTLLSIGRLSPDKGNEKTIQAFHQLTKIIPNSRLIIVGDGIEKDKLTNLVEYLRLKRQVIFTGKLAPEAILRQLAKSDIYLTASQYETFGIPVVEAWISGTPVLIPDDHPLARYVTNENGLLFAQSQPETLFKQMLESYHRTYDYPSIAKESQAIFSREAIIRELHQIYGDVLES